MPLTRDEIHEILYKIQDFHGKAYAWTPSLSIDSLAEATQSGGYLLRTKIRAAIEFLDQLYQYGKAGKTTINELGEEVYKEDRGVNACTKRSACKQAPPVLLNSCIPRHD